MNQKLEHGGSEPVRKRAKREECMNPDDEVDSALLPLAERIAEGATSTRTKSVTSPRTTVTTKW